MNRLVSIIIPCFNDAQYVEQAVDSALNQTYENIEVIVVDDGSNAETKSVLKKLESKITKLITQENKGQSAARNRGIELAKGDFILVLDSDDYIENTLCEKALPFFKDEKTKIVSCQGNIISEKRIEIYIPKGGTIADFLITNNVFGGASMFRKLDWKNCGGYDEGMRSGFEDWEFFIRILKEGGIAEVVQEPLYNYRKRINSTTAYANKIKYYLLQYIYLKHQDIYKDSFEAFVNYMLSRIEREEIEKLKNLQRIEYKIGKTILMPFRWFKSILK